MNDFSVSKLIFGWDEFELFTIVRYLPGIRLMAPFKQCSQTD